MSLIPLTSASAAAAGAGGFLLARAGAAAEDRLAWLIPGVVLLLAALAGLVAARLLAVEAERSFRNLLAAPEAAAGSLPNPFARLLGAVRERLESHEERLKMQASETRRLKVARQALAHQHDALLALLDSLSDGVVMVDRSGAITFLNRRARRFLGLGESGDPPAALLALDLPAPLKAALDKGLGGAAGRGAEDVDCSDRAERLILRLAILDVAPGDDAPEDLRRAVILSDVTREVELNRMKSNFASSVSHELKTPLSSMKAFLEMLLDGDIEGEEEQRDHLRLVLDETERLARLVQNLLNLSRLEAGITRLERQPVAIAEVLDHLRNVVAPLAQARRQSLVFEISEFLPPVTGDRNLLEQAFMNLISNAIKYTPEGGSVRVRAGLAGRDVELAVIDSGVGIPRKALGLVFEKFTRIENNAGLKATGTGLGLPMAKFVAEAHGGGIEVSSEEGVGSEFRIRLPVRRAEESDEVVLVGLEGISA